MQPYQRRGSASRLPAAPGFFETNGTQTCFKMRLGSTVDPGKELGSAGYTETMTGPRQLAARS